MAEYTLHIDLNGIPSDMSNAQKKLGKLTDPEGNKNNASQDPSLGKILKGVGAYKLATEVVNTGKQYLSYRVNTYGARYGDTARQNELNNMMTVANYGVNLIKSTAEGAIAGATFGPWGALAGAIIGTITDVIGEVIGGVERTDQWQLQQNQNTFNEIRASERLGMMISDRNR